MSGAITSKEHDNGKPPPRMSSKEAMPDDVKIVDDENDEARVPARRSVVLRLVFLLNVDILAQHHRFKWGVSAEKSGWPVRSGRLDIQKSKFTSCSRMASNVFHRLRPSITGALYVRLLSLLSATQPGL